MAVTNETQEINQVAAVVAKRFSMLPAVRAVALGGSHTGIFSDDDSDVDIYVYITRTASLEFREALSRDLARGTVFLNQQFFENGDSWVDASSGVEVDIMYRSPVWIEDQLTQVIDKHTATVGYTTSIWHNIRNSRLLFDRDNWYHDLKNKANAAYPTKLVRAIIARNHPLLRKIPSSYQAQIELSIKRRDRVNLNHRITALLSSYFDILYAVNKELHPGEKYLIEYAGELCELRPYGMAEQINALIGELGAPWAEQNILSHLNLLLDGIDDLLHAEKLL